MPKDDDDGFRFPPPTPKRRGRPPKVKPGTALPAAGAGGGMVGRGRRGVAAGVDAGGRAFPTVPLGAGRTATERVAELLDEPSTLDIGRLAGMSAYLIEAALADGVTYDDIEVSKLLERASKIVALANRQSAEKVVLAIAVGPALREAGAAMADVIREFVPEDQRERALDALRDRLDTAMKKAATMALSAPKAKR